MTEQVQQPVPPQPATAPLSAGTLFYLFADHVLPPAGLLGSNVEVPYSKAKVSATDLSALVFAVSCWQLRQQQALQLQPSKSKALGFLAQTDVALSFGTDLGPRSGYEDVIMRGVSNGHGHLAELVHRWFPRDVASPEHDVLGIGREEILQHGLGQAVDAGRGAVAGLLLGKTVLQVDPDRVRAHWEPFWHLHQGWLAFQQAEQPLATALVDACRRAISTRERDDDF